MLKQESVNIYEDKSKKLKQVQRRKRVIELRCSGKTIIQIAGFLNVSEKTVRRDLKSVQVREYTDELLRLQMKDIAQESDRKTRLHYRDKLLSKLLPHMIKIKDEENTQKAKNQDSYERELARALDALPIEELLRGLDEAEKELKSLSQSGSY